jgi:hypothetical protein
MVEVCFLAKDMTMPAPEIPMLKDDYVFITMCHCFLLFLTMFRSQRSSRGADADTQLALLWQYWMQSCASESGGHKG